LPISLTELYSRYYDISKKKKSKKSTPLNMAPSFIHVVRVLAVLMQAGRALTQTPDGFSPQTNNTLSIYYSGSAATSGTQISVTGMPICFCYH
jgi:Leucine-rich repeat (LRR) protein